MKIDYDKIKDQLNNIITENTVFVCIGTDKVEFDMFGPLCGTELKNNKIPYYGDMKDTLNGLNIEEKIRNIYKVDKIDNCNIIAIDAAVTKNKDKINKIEVRENISVKPGSGMGKNHNLKIGQHSIVMYTITKDDLYKEYDKKNVKIMKKNVKNLCEIIKDVYKK